MCFETICGQESALTGGKKQENLFQMLYSLKVTLSLQKKASSMLRKPKKDAEKKSDSMFARPASMFSSTKMTTGQVTAKVTPITMEQLLGPTDISWQEAVNGHLATAWKSKSVQDKLPDFLMNGAQFDGSPDQPKFRTGDGETVRQMNGQVYNPMIMLADAIGVSTSNQKRLCMSMLLYKNAHTSSTWYGCLHTSPCWITLGHF